MRKTRSTGSLEDPIAELEKYVRARLFLQRVKREMAEDQNRSPLKEFALPSNEEPHSSILNLAITANNFKLKPSLLQIVTPF